MFRLKYASLLLANSTRLTVVKGLVWNMTIIISWPQRAPGNLAYERPWEECAWDRRVWARFPFEARIFLAAAPSAWRSTQNSEVWTRQLHSKLPPYWRSEGEKKYKMGVSILYFVSLILPNMRLVTLLIHIGQDKYRTWLHGALDLSGAYSNNWLWVLSATQTRLTISFLTSSRSDMPDRSWNVNRWVKHVRAPSSSDSSWSASTKEFRWQRANVIQSQTWKRWNETRKLRNSSYRFRSTKPGKIFPKHYTK